MKKILSSKEKFRGLGSDSVQIWKTQSHLKENFIQALKSVLKENISDNAMFKEDWLPMAEDEEKMEHNTQHPLQEPKQSKSK